MHRTIAVFFFALAVATGTGHRLGLVPEDLDTIPWVRRVEQVPVADGKLPAGDLVRVDHSPDMPPIGNQGAQGSCVAWAHGYNHMTHNEFVERGWNVRDPHHQFSPAFLYNQVNGGRDWGTSGSVVMRLAIEQGCASIVDHPYNQYDYTTWPSESAYFNALWFRGEEACFIHARDTAGINLVRQHLANGYTCVIGIAVWSNFDNIRNFRNIYSSSERYGTMRGWHAVTIVGYDDTLTTADGPGAFRVANSWGTGWGDAGWFWMTYAAVMDQEMSGRQVEFIRDLVGYEPRMVGRVTISHPTRDRVGIELGVAPIPMPPWFFEYRAWRPTGIDRPFPDHPIVFDMTGGADFLTGGGDDWLYLGAWDDINDGATGSITGFAVDHLEWGTRAVSFETPVPIPDGAGPVFVTAQLPASGAAEDPEAGIPGRVLRLPSVSRGTLLLPADQRAGATLRDASGRKVMELQPGENDVTRLAPGVYFVRTAPGVHRVVLLR